MPLHNFDQDCWLELDVGGCVEVTSSSPAKLKLFLTCSSERCASHIPSPDTCRPILVVLIDSFCLPIISLDVAVFVLRDWKLLVAARIRPFS